VGDVAEGGETVLQEFVGFEVFVLAEEEVGNFKLNLRVLSFLGEAIELQNVLCFFVAVDGFLPPPPPLKVLPPLVVVVGHLYV
jgi:hypothetical protein